MRIIFLIIMTATFLFGSAAQTLTPKERATLLEKVKQTKKLKRLKLREKFKKARAHKLRKKLKRKLKKSRFQRQIRENRIKRKIHKLKVAPLMRLLFLLFYATFLFANESGNFTFESTLYSEQERIKGHTIDTSGTGLPHLTFDNETQHFTTLYTIIGYTLPLAEETWVVNLEGRGAFELKSDTYNNPVYKNLYGSEPVNQAILSQASIDYYGDSFAWSIGRSQLDLDWLSGSFDTVMLYSVGAWIETRAF